ncbi:MAG TPA: Rid family hydrolase [Candidatus Dormibacteraeota bacterium]|nr:Rid family hydrolase [Candidatus Dormibacteraeota bacterium]
MDKSGNLVGRGEMHAQAQQVFENLKAALAAAGATFSDVVKLNYYVMDATQLPAVREVRDRLVGHAPSRKHGHRSQTPFSGRLPHRGRSDRRCPRMRHRMP